MADNVKLETLQDEIKLLKGELKQSLASVRDYLLNMELPASEFSTILAALGSDGEQKVTVQGKFSAPAEAAPPGTSDQLTETEESIEDESDVPPEDEDLLSLEDPLEDGPEMESEEETTEEEAAEEEPGAEEVPDGSGKPGAPSESAKYPDEAALNEKEDEFEELERELEEEPEEPGLPETAMSAEEEPPMDSMEHSQNGADADSGIPKVNMLVNLIRWISRVKKEIGPEQLPVFLEVYGISGHLSPELKDVIIHLAEITADKPEAEGNTGVWSEAMLALHGILSGGNAPVNPITPAWAEAAVETPAEEEIIEVDKSREQPLKLKLVFPTPDGKNREYCLDLAPETNGEVPSEILEKKSARKR